MENRFKEFDEYEEKIQKSLNNIKDRWFVALDLQADCDNLT